MPESSLKTLEENFCELLFKDKNSFFDSDRTNLEMMIQFFVGHEIHVPYDYITKKVYSSDAESLELLSQNTQELLDSINVTFDEYTLEQKVNDFKESIIRHVNMSVTQKLSIEKASKEALKRAEKANKILKKTKNMKKNIYTDFITILGIFTAITFATFGGLQLLGNVYGNADTDSLKSIGGIVFLGANYVFGVYLILVVLLTGIKKLTSSKKDYVPSKFVFRLILISCLVMLLIGSLIYLLGYYTSS